MRSRLHWAVFITPVVSFLVLAVFGTLPTVAFAYAFESYGISPGVLRWLPILALLLPYSVIFLSTIIAYFDADIALSTVRIRHRTGWVFRQSEEIRLEHVEEATLIESFLGRRLDYAAVLITTDDGERIPLRYLPDARRFHARLRGALARQQAVGPGLPEEPGVGSPPLPPTVPIPAPRPPRPVPPAATPVGPPPPPPPPPPRVAPPPTLPPATASAPRRSLEEAWEELNRPLPDPDAPRSPDGTAPKP